MTSLVAWFGADSRSLSSAYIATDSRISWGPRATWDGGRKTFASSSHPDIFGYIGDVLTPSVVLSQFSTALDLGVLGQADARERFAALADLLKVQVEDIPAIHRHRFTTIHCARTGEGMASTFSVHVIAYDGSDTWDEQILEPPPKKSTELLVHGSGGGSVREQLGKWRQSDVSGTSRAIFSAFVDSVESGKDPLTGGPVQLVGLHRQGNGRTFGVLHGEQRYLAGSPVSAVATSSQVRWFNATFERCDGRTGRVIGQRQPRPGKL